MYRLILVDDEQEVRQGIINSIPWEKCGFTIAGEAENGIEALECAEKMPPDVLITDIRMPFMDGMALSEQIRLRYPTCKIVILTGFDEFEYAQKAIKLDVFEYILKPISLNELTEVLLRIKARMDEEIAQKKNHEALLEHYRKSLPVLREKFLLSLLKSQLPESEILDKCRNYDVSLEGELFSTAILDPDKRIRGGGKQDSCRDAFDPEKDRELLKFALLNITDEIVAKYQAGVTVIHEDSIAVIFRFNTDDTKAFTRRNAAVLEEIRQSIVKYLGNTVTIGVGNVCHSITEIHSTFRSALDALDYRYLYGPDRIICIRDMEPLSGSYALFGEKQERELSSVIKVGPPGEISSTISGLFKEAVSSGLPLASCRIYLIQMLTTIVRTAVDLGIDPKSLCGSGKNLFFEIFTINDIQEVKDWMIRLCSDIHQEIASRRQDSCRQMVKEALDYLKAHYHEDDLSIDKVCNVIHISPTYFSCIFKKETKMTFLNYLIKLRMEAAKELLLTTGLKNFEISEKVGYSEPNYFSYSFKKYFGVSPSQYRNGRHH